MTTIIIKARNNADARRMGNHSIRIPGADTVVHTGSKNVKVTTHDVATVRAWMNEAFEVESYSIAD